MKPYKEQIGKLTFDLLYQTIEIGSKSVALSPTEFIILMFLASCPNRTATREEIRAQLKDTDSEHRSLRTVDVHISRLKKKLNDLGVDAIKSTFGKGYFIDAKPLTANTNG